MIQIAPSILSADFLHLSEDVDLVNRHADLFHLDIMDGSFVPNISFGFPVVEAIAREARRPLDVHLMIVDPGKYIERFAQAGAAMISFHYEAALDESDSVIDLIHSFGVKAGIVINPDCPVEKIFPYLDKVDFVLLMSVFAGFGGQKFIPESLERIRSVRKELDRRGRHLEPSVFFYTQNRPGKNVSVPKIAVRAGDALLEQALAEVGVQRLEIAPIVEEKHFHQGLQLLFRVKGTPGQALHRGRIDQLYRKDGLVHVQADSHGGMDFIRSQAVLDEDAADFADADIDVVRPFNGGGNAALTEIVPDREGCEFVQPDERHIGKALFHADGKSQVLARGREPAIPFLSTASRLAAGCHN